MTHSTVDKISTFRRLHVSGCFVIPNPWDVGSAVYLQSLGFKALATTSSGFAWTTARPDGGASLHDVLGHLTAMAAAVDIPLNADFENGFADAADEVGRNVVSAVATGIAGLSIEDSTSGGDEPLYPFDHAVDRIRAARAAIDSTGSSVILTGRSEGFIRGRPDLKETIKRLVAYADAGADCLYAPGLRSDGDITAVVAAVAPKPVNVLVGAPGLTVAGLSALGVRRVSLGGALARSAWGSFMRTAREIAGAGTFEALGQAASGGDLNSLFRGGA